MKINKTFGGYIATWVVLLMLFCSVTFIPVTAIEVVKFNTWFCIGFGSIAVSFLGQLICSYIALKDENKEKTICKISLYRLSYTVLVITFIVGSCIMLIPHVPYWAGSILAALMLALSMIMLIATKKRKTVILETEEIAEAVAID